MSSTQKWTPPAIYNYHRITRSHFFGLLIILLLLLIYESSSMVAYREGQVVIKNAAEVMIKRSFWYVGLRHPWFAWLVYAALLGWAYWQASKYKLLSLQPAYFPCAIFESLIYALSLSSLIHLMSRGPMIRLLGTDGAALGMGERMALALGAGIYEELLFRLGILAVLLFYFQKTLPASPVVHQMLAVTISAALFSAFHYWSGRETAAMDSFIFRFYAGMLLGMLYLWRGIGVAAYTHAFYDLLLVFQRPPGT